MYGTQNISGSDFGQLLTSGGSGAAAAGGGFSFGNLLGGSGAAGAGSGLLGLAAGFIPGGDLAMAGLNLLSGVFGGGGTPMATTEFDNLHSPTLPPLDASRMKVPTADIYVRHARAWGISVEEVMALIKADVSRNNVTFDYAQDAWAYGPNGNGQVDMSNMAVHVDAYNRENPLNPIIRGEKGPRSAYGSTYEAQAFPAPAAAYGGGGFAGSPFAGMPTQPINGFGGQAPASNTLTAAEYFKVIMDGALKGAGQGAGDAVAGTPAGQQIKKDQVNSYLKEYQLPITFALLGIAGLAYKAFNK